MNNITGDGLKQHLNEQQLVEYVQQEMAAPDLQLVNLHLVECQKCAERLSSLILFAAENQLLKTEQENAIDRFLTSADYDSLKGSFISRAIAPYKRKGFRLIKRISPRRLGISFSFSFGIRLT